MILPLRVSVIIPTHNRKALLLQQLESLFVQTISPNEYEIIVVCDGVIDGTAEQVVRLYENHPFLHLIEQSQMGPASARNAGAKRAKGEILAFTDDDCTVTPEWLENLTRPFRDPQVVAVEGKTVTIISQRTPLTHQLESDGTSNVMPTCNAACRRTAFEQIDGFAVEYPFPHNEDADLAWRLEKLGKIYYEDQALVIHPPRPEGFKKKVLWTRYLESEFLLFKRNPGAYKKYRCISPWGTIYWNMFVVSQLRGIKSSFRYLVRRFQPHYFFCALGIVLSQWVMLIWFFPRFFSAFKKASLGH